MKRSPQVPMALASFAVGVHFIAAYALLPSGSVLHPDIQASLAAHRPMVLHVRGFAAATASLYGPMQFWALLRARWQLLQRWLDRAFLWLGLGVDGPSGLMLALQASGHVDDRWRWMTRNHALAVAAVALQLHLPVALVCGLSVQVAYPVVAWMCWLPDLLLAVRLLGRSKGFRVAT